MGGSRERRVMELVSPDEFQQVVDAFGVPVIELDEHLVVRSINGAAIKRDRRDLSEIVGRPFFESWPGLNSRLMSNAIDDAPHSHQPPIPHLRPPTPPHYTPLTHPPPPHPPPPPHN